MAETVVKGKRVLYEFALYRAERRAEAPFRGLCGPAELGEVVASLLAVRPCLALLVTSWRGSHGVDAEGVAAQAAAEFPSMLEDLRQMLAAPISDTVFPTPDDPAGIEAAHELAAKLAAMVPSGGTRDHREGVEILAADEPVGIIYYPPPSPGRLN